MLLHASRNFSPGGQGIGYQWKKIEPVFTLSLMEKLLCRVRSSGTAPLGWHHSSGAPLHKSNKAGPKGKRVVHVLPSVGKQFFEVLLRTKRDMWSPPAPADWLHGYILGGRRESAVLIRQVTTWKLERLGMKPLTAFHDLTNAFGSVKWEAMDRAAASLLVPNFLLGQQRYRLATTTIPGMDGDITLKIGQGRLMGDPLMVALFWVDDSLAACCGRRGSGVRTTACMASLVGWKDRPFTITENRRHNQTDCCWAWGGCPGACEVGEVLQRRV